VNSNSLRAWTRFRDDGRLTAARLRAFGGLCVHAPCTGQELVRAINYPGAWKRLSELEQQRFVIRSGVRTCGVTGETATLWDVDPDADPIEYVKPESTRLTLAQRVEELERIVNELRSASHKQPGQMTFDF
tara:strand:+ start:3200 stop:3592 length:393 start_codon:yes stop_codon:yes gene_type:complete